MIMWHVERSNTLQRVRADVASTLWDTWQIERWRESGARGALTFPGSQAWCVLHDLEILSAHPMSDGSMLGGDLTIGIKSVEQSENLDD
jgi:hypothetical protein